MSHSEPPYVSECPPSAREAIEPLIRDFAAQCRSKSSPRIEDILQRYSGDHPQALLHELLLEEIEHRSHAGEHPKRSDYSDRFPEYTEVLQFVFDRQLPAHSESPEQGPDASPPDDDPVDALDEPKSLGRYRVIKKIGRGGFGTVYLAHDPDLDRNVAIKLPRRDRFQSLAEMDLFIQEARTTAKLGGHPGIVTLYDIQTLGDSICIIQEFVNGHDLRTLLHAQPNGLPIDQTVEIVQAVAAAMAFAHEKGFYHRDLKPDNILIDAQGTPRIADFGLAIHEDQQRKRKGDQSGSPHYMSPERIRGESHRIDGRSDLWSLGVVFYELLTGRRPFQGETREALAEEICHREPVPMRQWRPEVASELDRICTKCLSKHKSDRYPTAHDLLEDLRWWVAHRTATPATNEAVSALSPISPPIPLPTPSSSGQRGPLGNSDTPSSGSSGSGGTPWPKAMPKGLRAFDREDREFFLELLPGPYDRHGLPESIRFWKSRIEESQPDRTFTVGLLYGPSGCGKTSLVKAGLLPRLAEHVRVIYVGNYHAPLDATLKKSLLRMFPDLPRESNAAALLQLLCRGGWLANDQKLLLIFDQFEQWLHTTLPQNRQPIIDALRQCDGSHVQSLLMARADFWMQTTRFMRELEAPIAEGENIAAVDLFSISHAKKVLELFGRAYGRFPENEAVPLSNEQQAFLDRSLRSISDEDKVIPVKLALFAELLKEQPWTPTTLETVGGLEGLGSLFLEQTFDAKHADAESKYHQTAARGVLRALLPDGSGSVRSSQKSLEELRTASGYGNREKDLQTLIELLDRKLRLITPVLDDSAPQLETNAHAASLVQATPSYQLTHDYLIPSLREWLQRKQRETPRGRAELALEDRTAIWKSRRENKHLPTFLEWLSIHRWVPKRLWTPVQHDAMRAADRMHWIRIGVASLGGIALGATAWTAQRMNEDMVKTKAASWKAETDLRSANVRALAEADLTEILNEIARIAPRPEMYEQEIRNALEVVDPNSQPDINLRLALFPWDRAEQTEKLIQWIERGNILQIQIISRFLRSKNPSLSTDQEERITRRLKDLIVSNNKRTSEIAQEELRFFSGTLPWVAQFKNLLANIEAFPGSIDDAKRIEERVSQIAKIAIAAIELLGEKQFEYVDEFLTIDRDPEPITQFVAHVRDRLKDPDRLALHLKQLTDIESPTDAKLRQQHFLRIYAFILAIAEFKPSDFTEDERDLLIIRLEDLYTNHPSRAVHSASGWLLRQWGKTEVVDSVDRTPLLFDPMLQREWYVLQINPPKNLDNKSANHNRNQSNDINLEAPIFLTMLAFPAGTYFLPESMQGTTKEFTATSPFAVCDRETAWAAYSPFDNDRRRIASSVSELQLESAGLTASAPATRINWWDASRFCFRASQSRKTFGGIILKKDWFLRLPSESEWEFVASGGMRTLYSFGSDASQLERYAWYEGNTKLWKPVAMKAPNPFGLFDIHGNTSEWTSAERFTPEMMIDNPEAIEFTSRAKELPEKRTVEIDPPEPREALCGSHWGSTVESSTVKQRIEGRERTWRNSTNGFRVFQSLPEDGFRVDTSLNKDP